MVRATEDDLYHPLRGERDRGTLGKKIPKALDLSAGVGHWIGKDLAMAGECLPTFCLDGRAAMDVAIHGDLSLYGQMASILLRGSHQVYRFIYTITIAK